MKLEFWSSNKVKKYFKKLNFGAKNIDFNFGIGIIGILKLTNHPNIQNFYFLEPPYISKLLVLQTTLHHTFHEKMKCD